MLRGLAYQFSTIHRGAPLTEKDSKFVSNFSEHSTYLVPTSLLLGVGTAMPLAIPHGINFQFVTFIYAQSGHLPGFSITQKRFFLSGHLAPARRFFAFTMMTKINYKHEPETEVSLAHESLAFSRAENMATYYAKSAC